ncbi:hypothetical protein ROSINTL182_06271 [Roseburia intestinalis L1-82]|uniref:Uncharacterized protein n=1 Tax=Roseburia intestinalis L1-82 TaxID=536231 RepID=C7G8P5_9FIRM|nr:hypothetical protein ROSINTL182_06271 [Roseburia intestinalis L1-82]
MYFLCLHDILSYLFFCLTAMPPAGTIFSFIPRFPVPEKIPDS